MVQSYYYYIPRHFALLGKILMSGKKKTLTVINVYS